MISIEEVVSLTKTKYEEGKIYKTKDYGLFHRIPGNRPIFQKHVDELVFTISEENLLMENPITVTNHDGGLGIVGGQHRWKASEVLGEYIYFMFKKDAGLREVRMLGKSNRDWYIKDWLESIIEETGKQDYVTLKEFADNYKISLPIALNILSDEFKNRGKVLQEFQNGNFEIADFDTADRMASLLAEVRLHSADNAWVDRRCMIALRKFLDTGDPKRLVKKMREYGLAVSKRRSVREYETQINSIVKFEGAAL